MKKFKEFLKEMIDRYGKHDVGQTAGQIAYFGFLSLFPFIVFMNYIIQMLHLSAVDIISLLSPVFPKDIINLVTSYMEYISGQNSVGILSLGIVSTVYLASRVIRSMEQAVNKAYGIKSGRTFISSLLVSGVTVICIGLMLVSAALFIVFSEKAVNFLFEIFGLADMVGAVLLLKWAFVIFVMLLVLALLYRIIPHKRITFASVVPGTVFALVCFMALSAGFGWYVAFATSSSSIYGYIGTVFVALMWLYFVGVIFVLGAEINGCFDAKKEQ